MKEQCPKCRSTNILLLRHLPLPTSEDEYSYQCSDCGMYWNVYEDMDEEDARDMRNYLELQREERGDY